MSGPEESHQQRLARNVNELLQELRVAQTGVQILFVFLLSVAFTERFEEATRFQQDVHFVTTLLAAGSSALLIAPAAWHRILFRRGQREMLVRYGNTFAVLGLALLAAALTGVVLLVADVVWGGWRAVLVTVLAGLAYGLLWFLAPLLRRRALDRGRPRHTDAEREDGPEDDDPTTGDELDDEPDEPDGEGGPAGDGRPAGTGCGPGQRERV
ncbi:MAG TPA: DUF6328 family protein [Pseudonocardiaceae bacterium]